VRRRDGERRRDSSRLVSPGSRQSKSIRLCISVCHGARRGGRMTSFIPLEGATPDTLRGAAFINEPDERAIGPRDRLPRDRRHVVKRTRRPGGLAALSRRCRTMIDAPVPRIAATINFWLCHNFGSRVVRQYTCHVGDPTVFHRAGSAAVHIDDGRR